MKYVKLIVEKDGVEMVVPVIFPNLMVHAIIGRQIVAAAREHWPRHEIRIESAGDVSIGSLKVGGKSETLNLFSLPEDEEEIQFCDVKAFRF